MAMQRGQEMDGRSRSSSSRCQCFRQIAMETLQGIKQQTDRYYQQTLTHNNSASTAQKHLSSDDLTAHSTASMHLKTTLDLDSTAAPRLSGTENEDFLDKRSDCPRPRRCCAASAMTASQGQILTAPHLGISGTRADLQQAQPQAHCEIGEATQKQCLEGFKQEDLEQRKVKPKFVVAANG